MQIISYIDFFISSLISITLYIYIINKVFNVKIIDNKIKVAFSLLFSSICISIINTFNTDTFKILFTFPFVILGIKQIFNENYNKTILYSIFTTIYVFIGELLVGILFSILPFEYNFISNNILGTTLGTIFVVIFTIPIIHIKRISKSFNNIILISEEKDNTIMLVFIIFAIGALMYRLCATANNYINILMSIAITITFIFIISMYYRENKKSIEISKSYNELFDYLEKYEKELIEKRKIIHDYKNQLIIINGYATNKKLKEYISELIKEQKSINEDSIIRNIDKLPRGLKGLIYYKFSHIDKDIKVDLNVSNIKNFDKLSPKVNKQVLKIIGILIDNAIESTTNENNKYISIDFYSKGNRFIMNMINPCNDNININNIMKPGYSTKGKNRGYGLSVVKDILKIEKDIELNMSIDNNEFINELIVKTNKTSSN